MVVTDILSPTTLGVNRQNYKQLKLALSLGLRRQFFVAVCDSLPLRNRLATHLAAELGDRHWMLEDEADRASAIAEGDYPRVVSLELNLLDPNPVAQMEDWIARHPSLQKRSPMPVFQFLGVEKLTKASAAVQWSFLRELDEIDRRLVESPVDRLSECSLLLWVPRPWCYTIEQSAPEFWRCRTGVFEFEGEPTPTPSVSESEEIPTQKQSALTIAPCLSKVKAAHNGNGMRQKLGFISDRDSGVSTLPAFQTGDSLPNGVTVSADIPTVAIARPDLPSTPPTELVELVKTTEIPQMQGEVNDWGVRSHSNAESLQLLQEVDRAHTSATSTEEIAHAYLKLGNFYREKYGNGNHGTAKGENGAVNPQSLLQLLTIAILAYERVLQFFDPDAAAWGDVTNDLGNFYWMRARYRGSVEEKIAELQRAIATYERGLNHLDLETYGRERSRIGNNLGAVYGELARYEDAPLNLQRSIAAYRDSLDYRKRELEAGLAKDSRTYAATQNNLGTAHWNLAQHRDAIDNLKQAIAAYTEALQYHAPEQQPLEYGMIHNNLGTAYWNLAQYEQTRAHLMQAIASYEIALRYRTPETMPAACAATENNLGTAYWHLANHSQEEPALRAEFLREAIAAYNRALNAADLLKRSVGDRSLSQLLSFDLYAAHNNLGLAHYQSIAETALASDRHSRFTHLQGALHHHLQALLGWEQQPDRFKTAFAYVVQIVRTFYAEFGIEGQNHALSQVPGHLLSELMARL